MAMQVGRVALLPYMRPGATGAARAIEDAAASHAAILLANHGPVVSGATFRATIFAAEELEETAKLILPTRNLSTRRLPQLKVEALLQIQGHP